MYSETGSAEAVDLLHKLGLGISNQRMNRISTDLANSVIAEFDAKGAPCSSLLSHKVFTMRSVDNIDINPKNRDATEALHGTAIVLTQLPTPEDNSQSCRVLPHLQLVKR